MAIGSLGSASHLGNVKPKRSTCVHTCTSADFFALGLDALRIPFLIYVCKSFFLSFTNKFIFFRCKQFFWYSFFGTFLVTAGADKILCEVRFIRKSSKLYARKQFPLAVE